MKKNLLSILILFGLALFEDVTYSNGSFNVYINNPVVINIAQQSPEEAFVYSQMATQRALQGQQNLHKIIDDKFKKVIASTIDAIILQLSDLIIEVLISQNINPQIGRNIETEVKKIRVALTRIPAVISGQSGQVNNPQEIFNNAWLLAFGRPLSETEDLPNLIGFLTGFASVVPLAEIDWQSRLMEILYGPEGQEILLSNFANWLQIFTQKL